MSKNTNDIEDLNIKNITKDKINKDELGPTNDLIFQHIFGKVGNEMFTKDLLEKILGIQIDGLSLDTNKRMQGDWLDNKIGRLDVKAKLNDGTVVTIEMQVSNFNFMTKRLLYYWASTYSEKSRRSEGYEVFSKVITVLISVENMPCANGIGEYHNIWEIRSRKHPEKIFDDALEIHTIELKKFDKRQESSPEDDWIRFIMAKGESEMEHVTDVSKIIEEAKKEYNRLLSKEENCEDYIDRQMELMDLATLIYEHENSFKDGKAEGEKSGIAKRNIEIAKNLLAKNMSIEDISEVTGLKKEEIEKLSNE